MKKTLKMMSFFAIAFCTLWIGVNAASAANFYIDVINGQDGSGINYGTITTTKNTCTKTAADSSSSNIITIASGKQMYIEVESGCTQVFQVNVNPGYEIDTVLLDRQVVEPAANGTYTFTNITTANSALSVDHADVAHSLCIKYKKKGAPSSPDTGDVSAILPLASAAVISLILMIVIACKRRSLKA